MGLRRDYGENPKIDSKRDADSGLGIEQRVEIVETKGSIGFINEAGFLEWVNHTGGKDYVDALNFIKSQGGVKPFDRKSEPRSSSESYNNSKRVFQYFCVDNLRAERYFVFFYDGSGKYFYKDFANENDFKKSPEFDNFEMIEEGITEKRAKYLKGVYNKRLKEK
jgi:hypothetical protein